MVAGSGTGAGRPTAGEITKGAIATPSTSRTVIGKDFRERERRGGPYTRQSKSATLVEAYRHARRCNQLKRDRRIYRRVLTMFGPMRARD